MLKLDLRLALVLGFGSLPLGTASAQFTWNGATNANWSTGTNWAGNSAPSPGATTSITLAGTNRTATVMDLPGPFQLNSLTMDSSAASGFNVSGGTLQFVGSAAKITRGITDGTAAFLRIDSNVDFAVATSVDAGGRPTGTGVYEVVFGGKVGGSGTLSLGSTAGPLSFEVLFAGRNGTYSGTVVNSSPGIIYLGAANALGRAATIDLGTPTGVGQGLRLGTAVSTAGQGIPAAGYSQQLRGIAGGGSGVNAATITLGESGTVNPSTLAIGFADANSSYSGGFSGSAGAHLAKVGAGTLTVTGTSGSLAGVVSVRDGTLVLQGTNGRFSNAATQLVVYAGGLFRADNTASSQADRLPGASGTGTSPILLAGGTLQLTGTSSTTAAFSENASGVRLLSGQSTILVDGVGSTKATRISFSATGAAGGLTQSNSTTATVFFRSTNLGQSGSTSTSATTGGVAFATAPTLVGGNATTATNVSILPFGSGTGAASAASVAVPESFVTYSAANASIRSLTDAEYASAFGTATDNVSLAATTTTGAGTANSLRITGGFLTINGSLNLASGALLTTGIGAIDGTGTLAFGDAAGNATAYITTVQSTSIGIPTLLANLSKNGAGQLQFGAPVTLTAANPFIAVNAGTLQFNTGAVATGTPLSASNVLTYQVSKGATLNTPNPLAIDDFKVLQGSGTVVGSNVTVSGTGVVRPSALGGPSASLASPGTLNLSGATFGPGGTYEWYVNSVFGGDYTQGRIVGTAGLNITATAANKFNIKVTPLQLSNAVGGPVYDAETGASYNWVIATFQGGITGNTAAGNFNVNYNPTDFAGANLAVGVVGNDVVLFVTPVPEPTTILGIGTLALGLASWARRRKATTAAASN